MSLSTQDHILIEHRVANEAKSIVAAYLIWFFLGGLGVHRFYLGRSGSGVTMLLLTIVGALTSVVGVGILLLIIVGIWWLVDAFLIPGILEQHKADVRRKLTEHALMGRANPSNL